MEERKIKRLRNKVRRLEVMGLTEGVTVVALALLATITDGAIHYGLLGAVAVLFVVFIAKTDAAAKELRNLQRKLKR